MKYDATPMKLSMSREPIIVHEAHWLTIVLVLVATFGLITAVFIPAIIARLSTLSDATMNLIVFSAIFVAAVVGVAFLFGGLRPGDVGLRRSKLAEAGIVVVSVWIVIQSAHAIAALLSAGSVQWDDAWHGAGATKILAWLASMVVGTALTEETIFRGFLFPQLHLKCLGSQRSRFWVAAVAAAMLFGLFHVPRHIVFGDLTAVALAARVLAHALGGLLATMIYLRTRNLCIVIGLHGIENAPTRLVDSPMPTEVLLLVEIALLMLWPRLMRRPQHRGFAPILGQSEAGARDQMPGR